MRDQVLSELTRWGQAGYHATLRYSAIWKDEQAMDGWTCLIMYSPDGSVFFGDSHPFPFGFHPTDPIEAARLALRQAGERWPEMVK